MQDIKLFFDKYAFYVLLVLTTLWLIYVGVGLWGYASIEIEPPVFDALSYVEKAKAFWAAVDGGKDFNLFSVEPTVRPFGTVLLSYPFGFSDDFRGFYFRSLFIPIVLFALTAFFAVSVKRLSTKQLLILFSISVALTSAPANFQLQHNEDPYSLFGSWGLVDTFFSAILGIATAFAIRKSKKGLVRNAFVCSIIASFSILVKPAGMMMMGVVAMVWLIIHAPRDPRQWLHDREFRDAINVFIFVYGVTLISVISSDYFSLEHAKYAVEGMKILHEERAEFPAIFEIVEKFHISIGYVLSIVICVGMAVSIRQGLRRYLFATVFVLVCGVWLWLFKTSIDQVRYFFPFQIMAIILVVPPILSVIECWPRNIVVMFVLLLLSPALLIGYILSAEELHPDIQRFAGTNMSANPYADEVKQAQELRDDLINDRSEANIIYYVGTNAKVRAFHAVMDFDRLIDESRAKTYPALPIDFVREHAYRLDEMIEAKYIVFQSIDNPLKVLAENKDIYSFELEELMIRAWLTTLSESDGVSIYSQDSLRVLKVVDKFVLNESASELHKSFLWRDPFVTGFTKLSRVTRTEVDSLKFNMIQNDINLYLDSERMASIVGAVLSQDTDEVLLSIYIKQDKSLYEIDDTYPWYVFVHLLQPGVAVKEGFQISYIDNVLNPGSIGVYEIRFSAEKLSGVTGFATGVYSPKSSGHIHMLSKHGEWEGKRFVVDCQGLCLSWARQ